MLRGAEYTAGIFVDNSYALFMACSLLIQHRNERIALISGPKNISTSVERIRGYQDALDQYQLPFDERLIKFGDYTFQSGYHAVMALEAGGDTIYRHPGGKRHHGPWGDQGAEGTWAMPSRRMWRSLGLTTWLFTAVRFRR